MNLCGYCLAALFPRNQHLTGSARTFETGAMINVYPGTVSDMAKDRARFYDVSQRPLPMTAVTSVRGTLCCAQHAIEEVDPRR